MNEKTDGFIENTNREHFRSRHLCYEQCEPYRLESLSRSSKRMSCFVRKARTSHQTPLKLNALESLVSSSANELFIRKTWMNSIQIFAGLEGIIKKSDDPECIRRAATEAIRKWNSDLTIFTDRSTINSCMQGGAAAVVNGRSVVGVISPTRTGSDPMHALATQMGQTVKRICSVPVGGSSLTTNGAARQTPLLSVAAVMLRQHHHI